MVFANHIKQHRRQGWVEGKSWSLIQKHKSLRMAGARAVVCLSVVDEGHDPRVFVTAHRAEAFFEISQFFNLESGSRRRWRCVQEFHFELWKASINSQ